MNGITIGTLGIMGAAACSGYFAFRFIEKAESYCIDQLTTKKVTKKALAFFALAANTIASTLILHKTEKNNFLFIATLVMTVKLLNVSFSATETSLNLIPIDQENEKEDLGPSLLSTIMYCSCYFVFLPFLQSKIPSLSNTPRYIFSPLILTITQLTTLFIQTYGESHSKAEEKKEKHQHKKSCCKSREEFAASCSSQKRNKKKPSYPFLFRRTLVPKGKRWKIKDLPKTRRRKFPFLEQNPCSPLGLTPLNKSPKSSSSTIDLSGRSLVPILPTNYGK